MGDAGSNLPSPPLPVVAPGDAGQSNVGGGGGGFAALDVGALSSLAGEIVGAPDAAAVASPRPPVVRSLSRKGERKPADGDGDGNAGGGSERPQLLVHGAPGDLGDATGADLS